MDEDNDSAIVIDDSVEEIGGNGGAVAASASAPASASSSWWKKQLSTLEEPDEDDAELGLVEHSSHEREQPAELLLSLLPFQRESLHWMCEQEKSGFRGGILADEMGLGKTIQSIALILSQHENDAVVGAMPLRNPPAYKSEGTLKHEGIATKEEEKAAKARARVVAAEAKKAAKAAERAAAAAKRAADRDSAKTAKEAEKQTKRSEKSDKKQKQLPGDEAAGAAAAPSVPAEGSADAAAAEPSFEHFFANDTGASSSDIAGPSAVSTAVAALPQSESAPATAAAASATASSAPLCTALAAWKPLRDNTGPLDQVMRNAKKSKTTLGE